MRVSLRVGIALVAVLALAGCQNKGENLPLEVARYRVFTSDVPERPLPNPPPTLVSPTEIVRLNDQLWQASFDQFHLPARAVRQIGSAEGQPFFALSWDSAPFDRLLIPVVDRPDLYQEFLGLY